MTHGSLFSGIGGFDLAAQWMGWQNVFHCEWDKFNQQVLHHHFPESISYGDITKTDFATHAHKIDILTGGFPCQPFSAAGKRKGTDDARHLWPEMLRAIREIRPRYVVGENVGGILNWSGGLVFEQVHLDLEAEGYAVQSFVLPACAVGAPHRRDRVWFVSGPISDASSAGRDGNKKSAQGCHDQRRGVSRNELEPLHGAGFTAHANEQGLQRRSIYGSPKSGGENRDQLTTRLFRPTWEDFPTQPPVCGGDDGLPSQLDGITFSQWRTKSVAAYGNAIVPQVAFNIFQAIQLMETTP